MIILTFFLIIAIVVFAAQRMGWLPIGQLKQTNYFADFIFFFVLGGFVVWQEKSAITTWLGIIGSAFLFSCSAVILKWILVRLGFMHWLDCKLSCIIGRIKSSD